MRERIRPVENRYEELNLLLSDPQVIADLDRYRKLTREHAELTPLIEDCRAWDEALRQVEADRELLQRSDDAELRELARQDLDEQEKRAADLEARLYEALLPSDPNDRRNVVLEIRAGAGGEEAALFVAVLWRMYEQYAAARGWTTHLVDAAETELGGFREVVTLIEGNGVYSRLRYESGVHRVQRVPVTEAGGRIHTSTVTVAVLPEAEELDVQILPGDLEIDTFRASGAGGQHVNRTDSAIRITHIPSGIVVTCQDQRSQHKNRERAMTVLRSRLMERESALRQGAIARDRKSQVGSGERSERIRTYNYPQGRVTDHRIGLTLYRLETILAGDLDAVLTPLLTAARTADLAVGAEGGADKDD